MAQSTISYRELTDKEINPISKIYDMYIISLVRLLKMFSWFLVFFSLGVLVTRSIEFIIGEEPKEFELIIRISSISLHLIGVIVGFFGIKAAVIQSKGSSLRFFTVIIIYDVVYFMVQSCFLYVIAIGEISVYRGILGEMYTVKCVVYYFVITFCILIFITVKAYRFYDLLCRVIMKKQFSNKDSINLAIINENAS